MTELELNPGATDSGALIALLTALVQTQSPPRVENAAELTASITRLSAHSSILKASQHQKPLFIHVSNIEPRNSSWTQPI